jgi:hypothetical protein
MSIMLIGRVRDAMLIENNVRNNLRSAGNAMLVENKTVQYFIPQIRTINCNYSVEYFFVLSP